MKKVLISGIVAGIILFVVSILSLYLTIYFLPDLALQYYNPAFKSNETGNILYFIHPFIISFALAWFWDRFKGQLGKSFWVKDLEFGIIYCVVATLPNMWLIYSAMSVTLEQVITWFIYGFIQAVIAGVVFARLNP